MPRTRFVTAVGALLALAGIVALPGSTSVDHSTATAAASVHEAGVQALTPTRLVDTRSGIGTAPGAIGEGQTLTVALAGRGPVPTDATVLVLNVTVDAPTRGGYVTVFPTGTPRPETSNVNMAAGQTVPNLVVVRVGAGGAVSFFNAFGDSHVVVDVAAYSRDDTITGVNPSRLLDTRSGLGTRRGPVGTFETIDVPVMGRGGVPPTGVAAVVLNVTADQPTATSFVTVWPRGTSVPNASNLNLSPGRAVANLVIVPVGTDGNVSLFNEHGSTHLLADVTAYIPSGRGYQPLMPTRAVDTRVGLGWPTMVTEATDATVDLSPWLGTGDAVRGVILNVTAAEPSDRSFVTVYPADAHRPDASNLNLTGGETVPNAVVVRPDSTGRVRVHNERGATHLIVDVLGVIRAPADSEPATTTPPTLGPSTTLRPEATTTAAVPTTTTTAATTTTNVATPTTMSIPATTSTAATGETRCVIGVPGAGGSTDLDHGFSPGYGYDNDPSRYSTRPLPDGAGLSDLRAGAEGCDRIIVHGFSEGGRRAKQWYCAGETLDGRIVGYVIDDPNYLPTDDATPCQPTAGIRVVLYGTHLAPSDPRWTIDYFLAGTGYGNVMDKTAARLDTTPQVSPRYFHEPYTRPSPPEIANDRANGGWW